MTQGDEPTLNGQIASVTLKPGMEINGKMFILNLEQYWSTYTYKFDSGCEGVSAMDAGANPTYGADSFTIGAYVADYYIG